jgi:GNAT superfamily N-acetyltransferase
VITVRPARPSDYAYVAATALKQAPMFVRSFDRDELALAVRAFLGASRIVVACSETDEDTLVGWAAAIGGAPWFVFVARDARGHGIGARLRLEVTRGPDDQTSERAAHRRENDGNGARGGLALHLDGARGARQ